MDVQRSEPNVRDFSLIVGRYSFQSYLRFVRTRQVDGHKLDERVLAQDWREIQQRVAAEGHGGGGNRREPGPPSAP